MEKNTTVGMQKMLGLFDSGSFVEIGAYLKRENGDFTGVVCGYGAINGKLAYAFAQDGDRGVADVPVEGQRTLQQRVSDLLQALAAVLESFLDHTGSGGLAVGAGYGYGLHIL